MSHTTNQEPTDSGGKEPGKQEQLYPAHEHVYRCQDCDAVITNVQATCENIAKLEQLTPLPEPPQGELNYRALPLLAQLQIKHSNGLDLSRAEVDDLFALIAQREQAAYQRGREDLTKELTVLWAPAAGDSSLLVAAKQTALLKLKEASGE